MTPVFQTYFYGGNEDGTTRGNCYQAVLATLLDLPLDEVPHFVDIEERGGPCYWNSSIQWLWERGYVVYYNEEPPTGKFYFVTGKSPRGDFYHVVIGRDGALAHDPHPDGTGVLTEEGGYYTIEKWNINVD